MTSRSRAGVSSLPLPSSRPRLRTAIAQARARGTDPALPLVLDLAAVEFMDSSALGILIEAAADGLVLRAPSRAVRLVVEATGLASVLEVEP